MISYFLVIQAVYQLFYYLTLAAFDTVCHKILLSRLAEFGISGSALSWFSSYLTDRQYYISPHNYKSPTVSIKQGVPQGSVLGPLLFIQPLGQIIRHHGFNHHCYADDIQIYTACQPDSIHSMAFLSSCVSELKDWLHSNFLSLNLSKTEILITGPPSLIKKKLMFLALTLTLLYIFTFTFMHLADAFIQSDLQCIQAIHVYHYVCSLGIEPTTFCATNAMLYH